MTTPGEGTSDIDKAFLEIVDGQLPPDEWYALGLDRNFPHMEPCGELGEYAIDLAGRRQAVMEDRDRLRQLDRDEIHLAYSPDEIIDIELNYATVQNEWFALKQVYTFTAFRIRGGVVSKSPTRTDAIRDAGSDVRGLADRMKSLTDEQRAAFVRWTHMTCSRMLMESEKHFANFR